MPEVAGRFDLPDRCVLGTVQIGLPYGRHKGSPLMSSREAFRLLDAAWELGIRSFDTAESYGESPARLATWIHDRRNGPSVQVITKVDAEAAELPARSLDALARFDGVRDRVILSHGVVDDGHWFVLRDAAERLGALAGQSVYTPEEVRRACARDGVHLVQAPGNLIDRRALDARGESVVRLDLRSVYLQGLLLETSADADNRAPGTGPLAAAVQAAASELGIAAAALLVASILRAARATDRVVLGIDHPSQLAFVSEAMHLTDAQCAQFEAAVWQLVPDEIPVAALDPRQWSA